MALTSGPKFEARAKEVAGWTPLQQFVRGLLTYQELAAEAPTTTIVEIAAAFEDLSDQSARKFAQQILESLTTATGDSIFRRRNRVLEGLLENGFGKERAMRISQEVR